MQGTEQEARQILNTNHLAGLMPQQASPPLARSTAFGRRGGTAGAVVGGIAGLIVSALAVRKYDRSLSRIIDTKANILSVIVDEDED